MVTDVPEVLPVPELLPDTLNIVRATPATDDTPVDVPNTVATA